VKDRIVNVCFVLGLVLIVGGLWWRSPWIAVSAAGVLLTGVSVLIGLRE